MSKTNASASEPLIGVLNAGSSSLKFAVFEDEREILSGQVEGIGVHPKIDATGPDGSKIEPPSLGDAAPTNPADALEHLIPWVQRNLHGRTLSALGHRVVHGGVEFSTPQRITPEILSKLEQLCGLAPLHQPFNLGPINRARELRPELLQVACFDTAFHRTIPDVAQAFALPISYFDAGIRRFGFHGLSYEYIASRLPDVAPDLAPGKVIVAHLGNGASLCALRGGVSIATTMGFTALDGLPMGTRSGELDPGIVLHLLQHDKMSPHDVETLLYRKSGVLGLSGVSSDFRELLASDAAHARFAVDVFCYRIARNIGSLAAALGGLDGLVFTAGIGEHAAPVRASVCRQCAWLGLELDEAANQGHGPRLSTPASRVAAYVIPTDENLMIARHTRALLEAR